MRKRVYKLGVHSLTVSENGGLLTVEEDDRKPVIFDNVREAAVSIGDTVGDWITKSLLAEAASEGLDIWKGLKNGPSSTNQH